MKGPAPSGWLVWTGRVLLAACSLCSASFFVARWAIDAPGLGARDAGLALFLAFASPLSLYACAALAVLAAVLAMGAVARRRPWRTLLCAFLLAALPIVYLALRG